MPVIKWGLPQITSWIWHVRLSYSTLCINCVTSLFPFNPCCSVECSALWSQQSWCRRGGRAACRVAQQAGELANGSIMKCHKGECKAHQMGGMTPCTSTWWSLSSLAESLQESPGGDGHELAVSSGSKEGQQVVSSALVRHSLSGGSSPGLLSTSQRWTHQGGPSRGHQDGQGWSTEHMERGWATWACQPGEGKDSRGQPG